ncbi:hypothetical protein [Methylorubrum rhodinum]|uniref:hypothetical protein n=1 Tax=Methylorubrum rhodinum TaxID=29428 RepID=UPI003BAE8515
MFDTARFLREQFDNPADIPRLVSAYGFAPPSEQAVGKWVVRKQVSAAWLPIILAVIELEHGAPVSMLRYINR